jgi:hypothetical protein
LTPVSESKTMAAPVPISTNTRLQP